jgi:hypothetical protein
MKAKNRKLRLKHRQESYDANSKLQPQNGYKRPGSYNK